MLITFVVDTSGSMNQKTANGMSLLDCAKAAIEHFIKIRSKDSSIRNDRFFLITTEESSHAIKSGWRDHFNSFLNELKNLHCNDLSVVPGSICRAFDLLNQFRIHTLIDNYGMGRNPWFLEPAVVVLLSDGGAMTTANGLVDQFQVPRSTIPFAELTSEAYRWDQRLFSILMKFSGIASTLPPTINSTSSLVSNESISAVCDATGGKLQIATNMKQMIAQIESLITKLTSGVLVTFDPLPSQSVPMQPTPSLHKMLYVRGTQGFWPIPESYYPDINSNTFPSRSTHPLIRYSLFECDSNIPENFPFDKYEVEPCSATQYLLANKINCVQTFVFNSQSIPGQGDPFGYLRPSSNGQTVNLFVFPYNYPRLWVLLDELVNHLKLAPSPKWKQEFETLKRFCTINLIPDNIDIQFTNHMNNFVKKLKTQSAAQQQQQQQQQQQSQSNKQESSKQKSPSITNINVNKDIGNSSPYSKSLFSNRSVHKILESGFDSFAAVPDAEDEVAESFEDIQQNASTSNPQSVYLHRNVFDIPKNGLLAQLDRMKHHLFKKRQDDEELKYHVPISQMGNYHETLNKRETLRDIDEDKKPNHPLFGNPYRKDKGQRLDVSIDEAEDSDMEGASLKKGPPKRRRLSKLPPPIKIAPKPTLPTTPTSPPPPPVSTTPLPQTPLSPPQQPTSVALPNILQQTSTIPTANVATSPVQSSFVPSMPAAVATSSAAATNTVVASPVPTSPSIPSPPTPTASNITVSPVLLSNISPPQLPTSPIQTKLSPPQPSRSVSVPQSIPTNNLIPSPTPITSSEQSNNNKPTTVLSSVNNEKIIMSIKKEIRRPTKNNIDQIIKSIQLIGGTGTEVNNIIRKQIKPLAEEYKKYSLLLRLDALVSETNK
ncbi:type A von Willebrand factor domain-containing protein [Heterostelium album PN500]|uniref:Type A von Willebrand factor domain-containing protein n=1 Tax=Heterostelium pallidum (strain ATCC 26659 / Pp 5 / PN500) TaxID=670386 RepID=D3BBF8_HETP5|nr:type A von Willebrand factor domain-containing protein [Heterostelium album PN500]EFA80991.1 type A von Willebrand factor domain-containing protein [Heterostelium album PN500]|eukprot:XP_020433109.1 type A von Willebrand factor domain-containing protein [Heterostelium album PN500]